MEDAHLRWFVLEPGVLALPTTKYTIRFVSESSVPYRVHWDGKSIHNGYHFELPKAQMAALGHMAELRVMGLEP